jgi:hypothetical protein
MSTPTLAARYRAACAALGLGKWPYGMPAKDGRLWLNEPDLASPAGIGCLLAIVVDLYPEAREVGLIYRRRAARPPVAVLIDGPSSVAYVHGQTAAEALIAAMEAAAAHVARRGGAQ